MSLVQTASYDTPIHYASSSLRSILYSVSISSIMHSFHMPACLTTSWDPSAVIDEARDLAAGADLGWGFLWTFTIFLFLADWGREERQTVQHDNSQIHHQTKQSCTHWVGKADGYGVFKEPGAPCHHVLLDGLHLEVCAEDAAHMKELMAVTYVVKAARCQALR